MRLNFLLPQDRPHESGLDSKKEFAGKDPSETDFLPIRILLFAVDGPRPFSGKNQISTIAQTAQRSLNFRRNWRLQIILLFSQPPNHIFHRKSWSTKHHRSERNNKVAKIIVAGSE